MGGGWYRDQQCVSLYLDEHQDLYPQLEDRVG